MIPFNWNWKRYNLLFSDHNKDLILSQMHIHYEVIIAGQSAAVLKLENHGREIVTYRASGKDEGEIGVILEMGEDFI